MNTISTLYRPVDHWRLVRRKPDEVRRFQSLLRDTAAGPAMLHHLTIAHDGTPGHGRCCQREPWLTTVARLWPEDAPRTLWVLT
jgi:hypothetical protein